jgi:hypothetical protein
MMWVEHRTYVGKREKAYSVSFGKLERKSSSGTSRRKSECNIKMERKLGEGVWIGLTLFTIGN